MNIQNLIMDIHNPIMCSHNCNIEPIASSIKLCQWLYGIMNIRNHILDNHHCIVDIRNIIVDIHNQRVYWPLSFSKHILLTYCVLIKALIVPQKCC